MKWLLTEIDRKQVAAPKPLRITANGAEAVDTCGGIEPAVREPERPPRDGPHLGDSCHPTQMSTTIRVTYPSGIGYRRSPFFGARIKNVLGPTKGALVTGRLVPGDVMYLQVQAELTPQIS